MKPKFFNAHHAPIGAFATFTLGMKGASGGFGIELAGPANEPIYIGAERVDQPGEFFALPFFEEIHDKAKDFDSEHLTGFSKKNTVNHFSDEQIQRTLGAAVDTWEAGDFTFRIFSPVHGIPDPETATDEELRSTVIPAIWAEIELDNSQGTFDRRVFFGYRGSKRSYGMRVIKSDASIGIGQHNSTAIVTDDVDMTAGIAFQPERILNPDSTENLNFLVGDLAMLVGRVAAGEKRTFRFALGFFREGLATTGIDTSYWYRRYFDRIEDVVEHAMEMADRAIERCRKFDADVLSKLSSERAWMLAQAIRSYFGATQFLETAEGSPIWVVNEGEYRMMNTFDLTVDQAYFELALNPWTVKNVLDLYVDRYAYSDTVRRPGHAEELPGGLAFTHDMGVGNTFSRPGYSGYEQSHLSGCFSYMSAEELMNWVLTAGLYFERTKHSDWLRARSQTLIQAIDSLANRDDANPANRNGVVSTDASRCDGGAEITTYDSLDTSLGQARNNLYLAVKGWACYEILQGLFEAIEDEDSRSLAALQSNRAKQTILHSVSDDGLFPAIIGEGVNARIIPAIEALVYPALCKRPLPDDLVSALKGHLNHILAPSICKFPDGGWKLSSTSNNSWLSKIYLCQFVAENILGFEKDVVADRAHLDWLASPGNAYFAWSDQMMAGRVVGSRYYPRGVTAALWLCNSKDALVELPVLFGEFNPQN